MKNNLLVITLAMVIKHYQLLMTKHYCYELTNLIAAMETEKKCAVPKTFCRYCICKLQKIKFYYKLINNKLILSTVSEIQKYTPTIPANDMHYISPEQTIHLPK